MRAFSLKTKSTIRDSSEILDILSVKYQKIETELLRLSGEDNMLQKLWSDLNGKYLDGTIRSDSEAFAAALVDVEIE